ncbi:hypothetical protein [Streptomyces cacaoi]|uniref:hypothetical protein n=1 Tax=Streptomyces cacaoi TaxID=1898 RepID=UPI002611194B|nr:hypothetical protein [Streptomyces cacaoi]
MSDGARLHGTARGDTSRRRAVALLHGGPGLPDHLGAVTAVTAVTADLAPVHRYASAARGSGG